MVKTSDVIYLLADGNVLKVADVLVIYVGSLFHLKWRFRENMLAQD